MPEPVEVFTAKLQTWQAAESNMRPMHLCHIVPTTRQLTNEPRPTSFAPSHQGHSGGLSPREKPEQQTTNASS